ncbi:unnamed protein product [Rhizophagus irregularis]|nr:unnamed protein product [Rhizophagus irregularis]
MINGRPTDVEIVPKHKGTRILGLYINPLDRHHQTLIKARSIIMTHVITMRYKKITHSHAIYIINRVIFPKLEYLFQHTILNYAQAQKLVVPLKKLFKKFFSLPLNTADNIIYNNMFPHIDNLLDLLVKSQTNSLLALFNTDTLRPIAIQKLDMLTQELWYPDLTVNYSIIGGHTPVVDYLPNLSSNDYKSLRNKRIMYLDQLVSPDGNYLLTWDEVKRLNNNNFKGPKPKWFNLLENDFILSNYRTLTYPLTDNYSIPTRLQNILEQILGSHKKYNEWTYHWNASIQNCIIGKIYLQDTDTRSSISIMEHYIPFNNSSLANVPPSQSSRSSPLILIPCMGCHLNDHSLILQDARIKCTISIRSNRLSVFNIFHRSNQEHKKYTYLSLKKYFVSTKPLHLIRHSAHSIYLAQHNINTSVPPSTLTLTSMHFFDNNDTIKQLIFTIQSALLCNDFIKSSLIEIAIKFLPFTNFEFYSDGSVFNIDEDTNSHIGLCPTHRQAIQTLLSKFKYKLIDFIKTKHTSSFSFDIESRINNSNMFKLFPDIIDIARQTDNINQICIPREQPWILLLHHLIPRDLAVFFDNYFSKANERSQFLIEFVNDFISELNTITWSSRSRSFKIWEKSHDITLKKKKNYRKNKLTSDIIPPLIADDRSSVAPIRHRKQYTCYYHNKFLLFVLF